MLSFIKHHVGSYYLFKHRLKLDYTVTIVDEDFEIEGRIIDIGLFFIKLKTEDGEEVLTPDQIT